MVSQGELATVVGIKRKADAKEIGRFVTDGKGAIRRLDCVDGIPQGAKPYGLAPCGIPLRCLWALALSPH